MVIRDKVRQEIDRMPEGVVVSASDFDIPRQYRATLIKALNQFEYAGIIKRISKGRYYQTPDITIRGAASPGKGNRKGLS